MQASSVATKSERERAARGLSVIAVTGTAAHAIRSVSSAFVIGSQGPKRLRFHVPIHLIYIYAFSCNIHVTTIELWKRESKKWYIIITQRAQEDCRNIFRLDLYKNIN